MLGDLRLVTIGANGQLTYTEPSWTSVNNTSTASSAIVLAGRSYVQTFSEDFRTPVTVLDWGQSITGPRQWFAHTPWGGDFGDAGFTVNAFGFGDSGLTITATKNAGGSWSSGLLCSRDQAGNGWTQAMGYFEARMKMPPGPGVWPAFWLNSKDDPNDSGELDVIEYYGQFTSAYNVTAITWPKPGSSTQHLSFHKTVDQNTNACPDLTLDYHTFGVEITNDSTNFYLDRVLVYSTSTLAPWKQPMCLLLNLALGGGWPIDQTPSPSVLSIDYVKAFLPANTKAPGG